MPRWRRSPMSVSQVAATNRDPMDRAAAMRAVTSAGE